MLRFLKSFLAFLTLLSILLIVNHSLVFADYRDILESIGEKTELENYETVVHADASTREGAKNITSAILFVVDLIKYVLGTIAVFMTIVHAIQLIAAGTEAEDKLKKQKDFIAYAIMGLMVVFVADEAIKLAFFGEEGEFLRDEETAAEYGAAGSEIVEGIYTFGQVFLGSIAVLMFIYSGFEMLSAGSSEDTVNSAKKRMYMAAAGLVVVGLSETVIKDVLFKDQGEEIDVERGKYILASLANFLVSVIGTISVLVFVYAGFLYIVNFGNDDLTGKAKKMMLSAVLGILLAGAAFAIVSTVIPVEGAK